MSELSLIVNPLLREASRRFAASPLLLSRYHSRMTKALIAVAPGAEEIETLTVADILVRAAVDVTLAAVGPDLSFNGSRDLPLRCNVFLKNIVTSEYDVVYIPGGLEQATCCRDTEIVQDLMEYQLSSGKLLAVICASPIALIPRKLAANRTITCYPGCRTMLDADLTAMGGTWSDQRIVQDGNLLTSQGPGTAMEFGLFITKLLTNAEQADTVAADLLYHP